jgi:hypothetical protein
VNVCVAIRNRAAYTDAGFSGDKSTADGDRSEKPYPIHRIAFSLFRSASRSKHPTRP